MARALSDACGERTNPELGIRSCASQELSGPVVPPRHRDLSFGDHYSSRRFRSIHRGVGMAENIFRIPTASPAYLYTDAGSDFDLAVRHREGQIQVVLNALRDPRRSSRIPNVIQKYRELVAAQARQNVFARCSMN
jgi:hypothetical protein